MKTQLHIGIWVVVALAALSCSKERASDSSGLQFRSFTLQAGWAEEAASRTEIQADGTTVMWSGEEHIRVFFLNDYNAGRTVLYDGEFVSAGPDLRETATFEGMIPFALYGAGGFPKYEYFWAVYPYDDSGALYFENLEGPNVERKQSVAVRNYASQQACAGSFASHSFPAVARRKATYQDSPEPLVFHNVCGGARFSVSQEGITSVTFRSAKGEPLAGKVRVGLDEAGLPVILEVLEGEDGVTVMAPEGGFVPGQNYYAVFLPQTLSEGLTVKYNKGTLAATRSVHKAITINRSRFGILDNLDSGLTFSEDGTPDPNGIIPFQDAAAKAVCVAAFDKNQDGELSYGEAALVTSLGTVFQGQENIVTFDEFRYFSGVRELPERGFANCSRLKQISLPDGLTMIGPYAFSQCLKLETIKIGTGLNRIEKDAFSGDNLLKNVHVPNLSAWLNLDYYPANIPGYGLPFYGSKEGHLFMDGNELTEIDIPEGITEIKKFGFYNCVSIAKISFPRGNIKTNFYSFTNCTELKTICSPSFEDFFSIEYPQRFMLDCHPFYDRGEGRHLIIGGQEVIHLVIPEGIKKVPANAFFNCDNITDVTIPESLESLGGFYGCTRITRLFVPSLEQWCSVGNRVLCDNGGHLFVAGQEVTTSLVIPEGVTKIGSNCFINMKDLEEVTLPNSFKEFGSIPFYNCIKLTRVHIPDITFWVSSAYSPALTLFGSSQEGHLFMNGQEVKQIQIPEGVTTSIVESAFRYCNGLESISIPKDVTTINRYAFADCTGLKSIVIGKDVSLIYDYAFDNCPGLESITMLPLSAPKIYDTIFQDSSCPIYVEGDYLSEYENRWINQLGYARVGYLIRRLQPIPNP